MGERGGGGGWFFWLDKKGARRMRNTAVAFVLAMVVALCSATSPAPPAVPARPDFPSMLPLMYPPYNYGAAVMPFYQNPYLMGYATGKTPQEAMQLPKLDTMPNAMQNMQMGTAFGGAMLV